MKNGKLIVFEGADAAGKSSICQAFQGWLETNGFEAKVTSFPGKSEGTIGKLVYDLHHNAAKFGVESITASGLQALHIAAHLDAIESQIIPALKKGQNIVLDRYWWSTKVYGVAGGAKPDVLDKLIEAEKLVWGDFKPAAIYYISRETPLRDEPLDLWHLWREGYDSLVIAENESSPVFRVENEVSIEDSVSKISQHWLSLP